ncbi:gamma-glutamyl-gamma-aminobutyrate hydrolase family protein [Bdellovibrio bacteriovorus]|uniref:gamma-glutamyl-gamma-aminobutyrate hydrolase family protein n=1 Tax=Bdellovibrio bacteriovorus TaxID=959 RepID=UPI0021CF4005|nr:gamma-glutamyl-gamma-aminobutyrate hydrolase family protein [Bdellovibrio bacteriovorus]UXR63302.1 gamma-glutamyl-gamma-aminobutyrate hydrolase family protein [Bdellovibrio bacteriovorus]
MKSLFVAAVLFISLSSSASELVRLYEWSPGNTLAPLILPVKISETPEQAAQRYLQNLDRNPELMELFEGRLPDVRMSGFKPLDEVTRESRALLLANLPKDYTRNSQRVENFQKIFAKAKHSSYILPINANLGLSQSETRDLFTQISEKFPFLVAMGGDDVEPSLYKKQNTHSRNTIPARDIFEIELIKSYVTREKGFLLGVCRGSQISSVALGYKLIQDVPFHVGTDVSHGNDWHEIELKPTKNNILASLLAEGQTRMTVNSLHHQSVIFKEGGPLQLAAHGHDGVTEATEFKNGRGLLLQFHPELMNNDLGSKILWRVLKQKNVVMPGRCGKIFSF